MDKDKLEMKLNALVIKCRGMESLEAVANEIMYAADDIVKNCSIPHVRLSCYKEVFKKFQEIEHESEFYG